MNRRSFLSLACASLLVESTRGMMLSVPVAGRLPGDPFLLGVASGDPVPDGFVLWTRLSTDTKRGDGGLPQEPMGVRWEVATDPAMRHIVRHGKSTALPELGHSMHVEVSGLPAHQDFWYRFHTADATSPVGHARTAPMPGAQVDRLRFAFASCQNYEHGYYHAHRDLAQQDVDAVLFLGDYIYEYRSKNRPREHTLPALHTLDDYRTAYAQYKSDPDLMAAHAAHPWIVTFDDHEVENNWAGAIDQENDAPAAFLPRRAAAFKAYYENMPLRRSQLPTGADMHVYRTLKWGRLAQFTVVDTRQFRTDQPCNDDFKPVCPAVGNPAATMMGQAQEAWFENALATSPATWNVVANQVMVQRLKMERKGQTVYNMDQWDGYPAARKRLTDFLAARRPSNPVIVTGDTHETWVGNLVTDFSDPKSEAIATELVGTSITSGGDGAVHAEFALQELGENPHIAYENDRRGYFVCDVTPAAMTSELRTVDNVTTKDGLVTATARFQSEAGKPGVQLA